MFKNDNSDFDLPDPDLGDWWLVALVVIVLALVCIFLSLGIWKLFDFIRPYLAC